MRNLLLSLLFLCVSCGAGVPQKPATTQAQTKVVEPKFLTAKIIATYPHHADAYTQGLLWHDGKFYESLGEYGHSSVRRIDPNTGKVEMEKRNSARDFGEGLALIGESLYQLTWHEGEAFVYDLKTLRQTSTFKYQGEGWGLTSADGLLYMSDGSSTIRIVDPATFRTLRTIEVRDNKGEVDMLNELEWIDGRLWANIYLMPVMAIIDPSTGFVESYVDCTALTRAVGNPSDVDVLNGIAYDSATKRIFVTGKLYDTLFEIAL